MKVIPVASPLDVQQPAASDKRSAAIAAFNNAGKVPDKPAPTTGQAQETAVANPNQVSVEELSAVKARTLETAADTQVTDNTAEVEAQSAPEPEAKPAKEPKLSQEYARLAKAEQEQRRRAQKHDTQIKQREAALTAREAEIAQKSELNQKGFVSLDKLRADPIGVLGEAGVPADDIVQQIINPSKIDPRLQSHIDKLEAKINSLEKAANEGNERMTTQAQAQYDAAVKQITQDTKALVNSDPNFETIKLTGSVKDVVELITETYKQDGILLTVEDAALEVENYLMDEAMKLTKIGKIQRKLTQPTANGASQKPAQTQTQTGQTQPQMKTLTNAASSTRKLSARERAMMAFKGELK